MAIVYQVFSNDGAGGPIDYSTVIATVSGTSYTTGALAPSGDYRFAVRAMDNATGLAEANTQASVRIVLDTADAGVVQVPNAPFAVTARATSGGGCQVTWSYFAAGQAEAPTDFLVYLTAGTSPSLTTPVATVAYQPGMASYSSQLAGLSDATTYTVSVVSRGAGASAASAAGSATVIGDATPPGDVEALTAVAVP
ncbi:MAG TPA: hypothetical protein VGH33_25270 [Isosphaeraceae bacterium]